MDVYLRLFIFEVVAKMESGVLSMVVFCISRMFVYLSKCIIEV